MSTPAEPVDPVSELAAGMAQLHELYLTCVKAGFTESQAIYLIGQMMTAQARTQP